MDAFGYNAAAGRRYNGDNINVDQPRGDGWSPQRDELAELIRRLRARYGRRRVFRTTDVENIVRELRWPHQREFLEERPRRLFFGEPVDAPGTPDAQASRNVRARVVIDLTMADDTL